MYPTEKKMMR